MGNVATFFESVTGGLGDIVPIWRSRRLGAMVGYLFEFALLAPLDLMQEWLMQGINAWGPGSPNATMTALPLIGQARGMVQGIGEVNADYAARLRTWIGPAPYVDDYWSNVAASAVLAEQIQAYCGNDPTVTVIERIYSASGTTQALWTVVAPDGTTTVETADWDWDSVGGWVDPTTAYPGSVTRTFWSDFWIVVSPPPWPKSGGAYLGQGVPADQHNRTLLELAQNKGAHCFCRAIIWAYDGTKFTPSNPTADGNYGNWGKNDGSGNIVAARDSSALYWIPRNG
jgi:hypothetical protein